MGSPIPGDDEKAIDTEAVDGLLLPTKPEAIEGDVLKEDEIQLVDSFEEDEEGQEPF